MNGHGFSILRYLHYFSLRELCILCNLDFFSLTLYFKLILNCFLQQWSSNITKASACLILSLASLTGHHSVLSTVWLNVRQWGPRRFSVCRLPWFSMKSLVNVWVVRRGGIVYGSLSQRSLHMSKVTSQIVSMILNTRRLSLFSWRMSRYFAHSLVNLSMTIWFHPISFCCSISLVYGILLS
jgi:hypothetical protein